MPAQGIAGTDWAWGTFKQIMQDHMLQYFSFLNESRILATFSNVKGLTEQYNLPPPPCQNASEGGLHNDSILAKSVIRNISLEKTKRHYIIFKMQYNANINTVHNIH